MFKGRAVEIAGIGAYAPEKVLSNYDLEKIVEKVYKKGEGNLKK